MLIELNWQNIFTDYLKCSKRLPSALIHCLKYFVPEGLVNEKKTKLHHIEFSFVPKCQMTLRHPVYQLCITGTDDSRISSTLHCLSIRVCTDPCKSKTLKLGTQILSHVLFLHTQNFQLCSNHYAKYDVYCRCSSLKPYTDITLPPCCQHYHRYYFVVRLRPVFFVGHFSQHSS